MNTESATMKNTAVFKIVGAAAAALLLNACGGGGLSSATTSATSFNLQQGMSGLVTNGQSSAVTLSGTVVVSGTSVPFTGSGTLTLNAASSATFNGEGALAQTETISGTITAEGQSATYSSAAVDYYATGDYALLGETTSSEYDVAPSAFTYPASVTAGSSGVLGTTSDYTDSSMNTPAGTTQFSYAVTAQSGSTTAVSVAITEQIYDTGSNLLQTDVTSYSLSDAGVLTLVSASVQNSSESLTVTVH